MFRHISDVIVSELHCVFSTWATAFVHFVGIVVVNVMVSRFHKIRFEHSTDLIAFCCVLWQDMQYTCPKGD